MNTKELIEKISKALSFKYPNDRMMPGVTISHLKSGDFYVSLIRYNPEKTVLHKFQDRDLDTALRTVGRYLLESQVRELNPLDDLNDVLGRSPAWPCPDPHAYPPAYDDVGFPVYGDTVLEDESWAWEDDDSWLT